MCGKIDVNQVRCLVGESRFEQSKGEWNVSIGTK